MRPCLFSARSAISAVKLFSYAASRAPMLLLLQVVHQSTYSASQFCDIEVQQQADGNTRQPQVREKLSLVDRLQSLDRLQFNDLRIFYQ